MNLQRREEIRVIAERPNDMHWAQEMRRAVAELLAHIDTLEQTTAERVIDSGRLDAAEALARRLGETVERMSHGIKPSSSERCAARWARSSATDRGSFERGWEAREAEGIELTIADGSRGPTPDYTGEGSAWVPPAVAPAAVVPENLLHDLAVAAWDEGADAGMVWDPDSDPAKRGVAPCTPEEGIAKARDHFAKHGSGSPSSAFSRALQAIREHSRTIPAGRVLGEGMVAVDRNALLSLFYVDDNGGPRFPTPREKSVLDALRANQGGAAT